MSEDKRTQPFTMTVLPFEPRKYSYSMDTSRWSIKQLHKNMEKRNMYFCATKLKEMNINGKEFLEIDKKFNTKLNAELNEWNELIEYQEECKKLSSICIIQRAIREFTKTKQEMDYIYCSRIVKEIITTEQTYVKQLDIIVNLLMKPLEQLNKTNPIITEEQQKLIFYSIDSIQATNHALLDGLIEQCTTFSKDSLVGTTFLDFLPYIKMYADYCKIYNNISDMVS